MRNQKQQQEIEALLGTEFDAVEDTPNVYPPYHEGTVWTTTFHDSNSGYIESEVRAFIETQNGDLIEIPECVGYERTSDTAGVDWHFESARSSLGEVVAKLLQAPAAIWLSIQETRRGTRDEDNNFLYRGRYEPTSDEG